MRFAFVVVGVLSLSTLAIAQAPPPGEPPPAGPGAQPAPPPPPPPPAPPPGGAPTAVVAPPPPPAAVTTVDKGTLDDANAGRAWLSPTALTPPAGTWSFEDVELFLIGVSYAVTDNFVITGTTMVPITSDLYWGFFSAKAQVVKQGNVRVAIQGGLAAAAAKDTTTDAMGNTMSTTTTTSGGEVGAAATLCLDGDCYSHLDGFVGAAFAYQNNASVPVGFSASWVQRLGKRVRLVVEADSAHLFGDISGQANGILGWYGLRFTSRSIGADVGFVKPICSDCSSSTFPIGFPVLAFSYRGID
ncbi:MAG: hypothetical protein ACM31C_06865 [Acidobacteriota bacterium]